MCDLSLTTTFIVKVTYDWNSRTNRNNSHHHRARLESYVLLANNCKWRHLFWRRLTKPRRCLSVWRLNCYDSSHSTPMAYDLIFSCTSSDIGESSIHVSLSLCPESYHNDTVQTISAKMSTSNMSDDSRSLVSSQWMFDRAKYVHTLLGQVILR